MILLIDNYDSFVHNLARYFKRLGQETMVVRNDAMSVEEIRRAKPRAVVLSPGPCTPKEAGNSIDLARGLHTELPLLGICLGHQIIAAALGGQVVRADVPMHGRTSPIEHVGSPLFAEIPSPFVACRYHSLVVDSLPSDLRVTAHCDDQTIMALEHVEYPVCGVQFHPEAVLTEHGFQILANFLKLAGIQTAADANELAKNEHRMPRQREPLRLRQPVTF